MLDGELDGVVAVYDDDPGALDGAAEGGGPPASGVPLTVEPPHPASTAAARATSAPARTADTLLVAPVLVARVCMSPLSVRSPGVR